MIAHHERDTIKVELIKTKKELKMLKKQQANTNVKIDHVKEETYESRKAIKRAEVNIIKNLKKQLTEKEKQLISLRRMLRDAQDERDYLAEQLQCVKDRLQNALGKVELLSHQLEKLNSQNSYLLELSDKNLEEVLAGRDDLREFQRLIVRQANKLSFLQKTLSALSDQIVRTPDALEKVRNIYVQNRYDIFVAGAIKQLRIISDKITKALGNLPSPPPNLHILEE